MDVGDLHRVTQVIISQPGYFGENHIMPYVSCILCVLDLIFLCKIFILALL